MPCDFKSFYRLTFLSCFSVSNIEPHLKIQPTGLLCLMNHISGHAFSNQERRRRIVLLHILFHKRCIGIGITVSAKVTAGVICPDVRTQKAGAFIVFSIFVNLKTLFHPSNKCYFKTAFMPLCSPYASGTDTATTAAAYRKGFSM